jgi:hypothetical protein
VDRAGRASPDVRDGRCHEVHPAQGETGREAALGRRLLAGQRPLHRIVEFAAALGLTLPAATGTAPVLTLLAAAGLAVTTLLAALTHARRKESSAIGFNIVLLILAALVAWGRFGPYSF